jgi:glycosyltransferase involved in cell wall biosynthesis
VKILFITFFFPPYKTVASIRTGKTAKLLHEMGHEIRVVSAKNSMKEELEVEIPGDLLHQTPWFSIDEAVVNLLGRGKKDQLKGEVLHGGKMKLKTKIIQKLFSLYKFFLYVPDQFVGWYKYAVQESEEIIKDFKPDIIYASSGPYTALMIGAKLSKKYNIPFVAELRDLWADNHYDKQYSIGRFLEYITLKDASALVSVSQPLVETLSKKYKVPCYEVRNAFDAEDFKYTHQRMDEKKIIITYTGMMYAGKRDPLTLFQAIASDVYLKENVECLFYGNSLGWVNERAKEFGITANVKVFNPIEREEVLKLQARSDILLLLTWDDPLEKGVFTGKLFEYIGSAKPILSIGAVDDVASNLIKENGFGLASNDTNEIVTFIKNIKNRDHLESIENGYKEHRAQYERRYQVQKLVEIFDTHR